MLNKFKKETKNVTSSVSNEERKILFSKGNIVKTMLLALLVGLIIVAGYFFLQYKKLKDSPNMVAKEETQKTVSRVAKIIELPQGEDPTMATISDKEKLKDQDFFKNAENGDKILMYSSAKIAFLYRPSANKIIKVAPLALDHSAERQASEINLASNSQNGIGAEQTNQGGSQATEATEESTVKVVVNNGGAIAGLVNETKNKLAEIGGVEVVNVGQAKKSDYAKTLVVDLTGKNSESVNKIAATINGEISSLPEGETKLDGIDVLIIVVK